MNRYKIYISYSASIIFTVLIGVMYLLTPTYADDTWYLAETTGIPGSWEYFTTTLESSLSHATYDTGRLCNIVSAIFLGLTPRWVYALLTSLWVFFILRAPLRLLHIEPLSPLDMLWNIAILFLFPWFDCMFTIIFSINYVWTIGWGLLWLLLFCKSSDKSDSTGYYVLLLLLGWITGWWHEGFSVPFAFGLFIYFVISRRLPNRRQWWLVAGMCLGILSLIAMPATWHMIGIRKFHLLKPTLWESLANIFAFDCGFYILLLLIAISLLNSKMRKSFLADKNFSRLIIACFAGLLPAVAIYLRFYNGQRTGAFIQVACSLIGLVWFIKFTPGLAYFRSRGAKIFATITILLCTFSLSYACFMQHRLLREINDVKELAQEAEPRYNEKGKLIKEVFYDKTGMIVGFDMLKPNYVALNTKYGLSSMFPNTNIELMPASLADFDARKPGVKHINDSLMIYKNRIISPLPDLKERVLMTITTDKGDEILTRGYAMIFHDSKGRKLYYLDTHSQRLDNSLNVVSASIISTTDKK